MEFKVEELEWLAVFLSIPDRNATEKMRAGTGPSPINTNPEPNSDTLVETNAPGNSDGGRTIH